MDWIYLAFRLRYQVEINREEKSKGKDGRWDTEGVAFTMPICNSRLDDIEYSATRYCSCHECGGAFGVYTCTAERDGEYDAENARFKEIDKHEHCKGCC